MLRPLLLILLTFFSMAAHAGLEVNVEPENEQVEDNIQAFVGEVEASTRREMERLAGHSKEQAIDAAQALGYYQAEITHRITGNRTDPVLVLEVQLGEPVRLREVDIRVEGAGMGTEPFDLQGAQRGRLQPGDVLHHGHYEAIKSYMANQALRFGYFSGQFSQQRLLVNIEDNVADITLVYQTGERFRLGDVVFSETPFDDNLLQRMVDFRTGAPYDADLLAKLNRDLLASGYFENVLVSAPASRAEEGLIPVEVQIAERKPHSLGLGAGYSTDVGARGRISWTEHWVNARGHKRGAELELSLPRQALTGYYQIPLTHPQTNSVRFFGGWQNEDIDDIESQSFTVGAQHEKLLDSGWERIAGLRLEHERFSLGNDSGQSTLLIPGVSFQRTKSVGGIDPSRGYSLMLDLQGAKKGVVSDVDFARVFTTAKGLYTFEENHRFLARVGLGAVYTDDFEQIPPSLRFFAGGDQSVRGYDYRSLSPTDDSGERVGGRFLLDSSLEYQYEFIPKWRAATFVDHGNAMDSLAAARKTSVGVGIRWVSPVGPIRVDLAQSISDSDEGFRIHFSMGPEL
ncbi:autotransporter assembly complex protein TamA [Halopseudomonas salina]|uniref:Translocation and assembly module subunit TamA n=1 Tax=Halopseudomonas salina TaxID=1323744 RepID=A0ABQ1PST2_9GAMM|nr:autotransporter assembly complex family protein [Halopseudomonas salina]GGD02944.1 outer membrane protein assembly factor [Halopseudomonas salina]